MTKLSVCIITLNEEKNLKACLDTLPSGCEIIVVDSGSQDETLSVARKYNAQIFTEIFKDYATQKNFALKQATKNYVLILDADERLEEKSRVHIAEILEKNQQAVFSCTRQLVFLGKKLRFGKNKDHVLRLFPRGLCHLEGEVHESLIVPKDLPVKKLRGRILHESYNSLEDYIRRLNRYTTLVAAKNFGKDLKAPSGSLVMLRVDWEFFKRYFLLGGFLDGFRGYLYASLSSVYVLVKLAKLKELEESL